MYISSYSIIKFGDETIKYYFSKKKSSEFIRNNELTLRLETISHILRITIKVLIVFVSILMTISILGYQMAPLLSTLGMISIGLSLGLQSFVKDFVAGFFILIENSISVGDFIKIKQISGIVEDLTLRTLYIRDQGSGSLTVIPFGAIDIIENRSKGFSYVLISTAISNEESPQKISNIVLNTLEKLKEKFPEFKKNILSDIEMKGIVHATHCSTVFRCKIKVTPAYKMKIKNAFTTILKQTFDDENIKIPMPPKNEKTSISNTKFDYI